jgi:protein-tyrosine-phosphatase
MAEGFARRYGSDVMDAASAGLAPAAIVQPLTQKVMADKNIDITAQFPKDLSALNLAAFDLIVNMSGNKLPPAISTPVRTWNVVDPIGAPEELYVRVRDQIENEVMRLILELRREARTYHRPSKRRRQIEVTALQELTKRETPQR